MSVHITDPISRASISPQKKSSSVSKAAKKYEGLKDTLQYKHTIDALKSLGISKSPRELDAIAQMLNLVSRGNANLTVDLCNNICSCFQRRAPLALAEDLEKQFTKAFEIAIICAANVLLYKENTVFIQDPLFTTYTVQLAPFAKSMLPNFSLFINTVFAKWDSRDLKVASCRRVHMLEVLQKFAVYPIPKEDDSRFTVISLNPPH